MTDDWQDTFFNRRWWNLPCRSSLLKMNVSQCRTRMQDGHGKILPKHSHCTCAKHFRTGRGRRRQQMVEISQDLYRHHSNTTTLTKHVTVAEEALCLQGMRNMTCGQMSIKKLHPILYYGLFLSGCVYILCWIQIFFPFEWLLLLQDTPGLQRPKCDKILWKGKQIANLFSFSFLTPCNDSAHQQTHQATETSTPSWVFPEEQLNLVAFVPLTPEFLDEEPIKRKKSLLTYFQAYASKQHKSLLWITAQPKCSSQSRYNRRSHWTEATANSFQENTKAVYPKGRALSLKVHKAMYSQLRGRMEVPNIICLKAAVPEKARWHSEMAKS